MIPGSLAGIERLHRKRGAQTVSFDDVAGHLADYAAERPQAAAVVDELAGYLADVEDTAHRHRGGTATGTGPDEVGS